MVLTSVLHCWEVVVLAPWEYFSRRRCGLEVLVFRARLEEPTGLAASEVVEGRPWADLYW